MSNLDELTKDWKEDPQLDGLAFENVEELAQHLLKCHRAMMNGKGGILGYLYKKQTLRMKELTKKSSESS